VSRFLFDGLVFDATYFRKKMAESRKRKQEQRERVRRLLAGTRSGALVLPGMDPSPDLLTALNQLAGGSRSSLRLASARRLRSEALSEPRTGPSSAGRR
jgi:hypothetical protein